MKLIETWVASQGQIYLSTTKLRTPWVDYLKNITILQVKMVTQIKSPMGKTEAAG
jgi:hypothetical protein